MYNFSMMPLNVVHFDDMCADIKDQYRRGITTCPLFIMTLVPEGDPVWDKAGPMCEKFGRLLAAIINLGYDPLDPLDLICDFMPEEITRLTPSGKEDRLDFTIGDNGTVTVNTVLSSMYPLVIIIKH